MGGFILMLETIGGFVAFVRLLSLTSAWSGMSWGMSRRGVRRGVSFKRSGFVVFFRETKRRKGKFRACVATSAQVFLFVCADTRINK